MINQNTRSIVCVATAAGKTHDFALFKSSRLVVDPDIEMLGDTGYQGLAKLHSNSLTPHRRSKHNPLSHEQKQHNHDLSARRIVIEHVLRTLKRFRILSCTYRNRRKRFGLRLNLLAAITNLHK